MKTINNINTKKQNYFMVKNMFKILTMLMFFCLLCVNSIYSAQIEVDRTIARYEFEEGSGSVIIDSSGNSHHGIGVSVSWDGDPWVRWGDYSIWFDGSNDYVLVDTLPENTIPFNTSMSVWLYPYTSPANVIEQVFLVDDSVTPSLETGLAINSTDWTLLWYYTDSTLTQRVEKISNITLTPNTYNHVALNIYLIDSSLDIFVNGALVNSYNLNYQLYTTPGTVKNLWLGSYVGGSTRELDANMDELRFFSEILNINQVQDLYLNNDITFYEEDEAPQINVTTQDEIILYMSPDDEDNVSNPVSIDVITNHKADCDLYIDNELEASYENTNGFGYDVLLESGVHTYFIYCSYEYNNTEYYEISEVRDFTVLSDPPTQVTFKITPDDFNIGDYELWITTPCLERGGGVEIGNNLPYQPRYNPSGATFSKVDSEGFAIFNLSPEIHEFCLFSGRLIVNDNNQTINYDVVEVNNNIKLGNIDIPNNVSSFFEIIVKKFDILPKYDPEAWGETWSSVIGGLVLLFLGIVTLMSGIALNNGKITIGGVLLILGGMGVSFGGLLGVLF